MVSPRISHPGLSSTFNGLRHPISSEDAEVWQFRGIKYGQISTRFRQSTLNESFPEVFNASTYGPKCPQAIGASHLEDPLIGLPPGLASHAADIYDEFDCLNLNITTPAQARIGSNLPVMIYVHGGGGRSGANSDWWCDGGSLVRKSILIGKPVVMVAINYRLAVLGFLGSSELRSQNGDANGGNFGLRDIHTAIEWVSKHIAPFGGSPTNITIYGESAGSHFVQAQIHSLLPANFHRAISQSQTMGAPLFTTPQTLSHKSSIYETLKKHLNITPRELETIPWQDLLAAYQLADPMHSSGEQALIDDAFLSADWATRPTFPNGSVILGNTGAEGTVVTLLLSAAPATAPRPPTDALLAALAAALPAAKIPPLLRAYALAPTTPAPQTAAALLALIEDLMWYKPAHDLAARLRAAPRSGGVFEYSFEQRQPFTGPFQGTATHTLDLAYVHGDPALFSATADAGREIAVQDAIQGSWIAFANGGEAWDENKVRVFGPRGTVVDMERAAFLRDVRRGGAWGALEVLTDEEKVALSAVALGFYAQLVGSG